jgi:hypothetical protein
MDHLRQRAKGNFLYATLIVNRLQSAVSIHDVIDLITSSVPDDLVNIYRRIFSQYQKAQHKYVRYVK